MKINYAVCKKCIQWIKKWIKKVLRVEKKKKIILNLSLNFLIVRNSFNFKFVRSFCSESGKLIYLQYFPVKEKFFLLGLLILLWIINHVNRNQGSCEKECTCAFVKNYSKNFVDFPKENIPGMPLFQPEEGERKKIS